MPATTTTRAYETTHPWLTFSFDLNRLRPVDWLLFGEAQSKCEDLAGTPLRPEISKQLNTVYLSKGAHGTTSIEGNTLSEDEVRARVDGQLELPISRQYLGQEIDNLVEQYNRILDHLLYGIPMRVSQDALETAHGALMKGQPLDADVLVGQFREHQVGVMRYKGAPAEDCPYLIDRLCEWLSSDDFRAPEDRPDLRFPLAVLRAIIAHLYVAWIHPFGDGNGRIARLVEFQLLVEAGIPLPACHLLSDHYNATREAYYQALDITSRRGDFPVELFVRYAMQGFVDQLRSQVSVVRDHQMEVTWENHVHSNFKDEDTPARRRQKHIALDMPVAEPTPRSKIRLVSARVAEAYAGKTSKTVSRDLNALLADGLIKKVGNGVVPNRDLMRAFIPPTAPETTYPLL